jgi:hypothetical protein
MDINVCPECGVPEVLIQRWFWLNNGDIVQGANQAVRLGFIECENLDPLFKQIGEIIGLSIEPLVVDITSRGAARFTRSFFPEAIREAIQTKQIGLENIIELILDTCHIMGYGRYENVDFRYERDEDDYSILRIEAPFSVPEAAGSIAGVLGGLMGGDYATTYEEISPGVYVFNTHWSEDSEDREEREEKLELVSYSRENGDLELEKCATCGAPKALNAYGWDLDRGLIVNKINGHRMAILGPELLDTLFDVLEEELGETIPATVVEAQRRFTKTGFYSIEQVSDKGDFRTQLALRGLGNLREIRMGPPGLFMRISNAAGHLLTVGMVQGLFEMAFDVESNVDWALSGNGNLEVQVSPKA